jgi:hypothetical protein
MNSPNWWTDGGYVFARDATTDNLVVNYYESFCKEVADAWEVYSGPLLDLDKGCRVLQTSNNCRFAMTDDGLYVKRNNRYYKYTHNPLDKDVIAMYNVERKGTIIQLSDGMYREYEKGLWKSIEFRPEEPETRDLSTHPISFSTCDCCGFYKSVDITSNDGVITVEYYESGQGTTETYSLEAAIIDEIGPLMQLVLSDGAVYEPFRNEVVQWIQIHTTTRKVVSVSFT